MLKIIGLVDTFFICSIINFHYLNMVSLYFLWKEKDLTPKNYKKSAKWAIYIHQVLLLQLINKVEYLWAPLQFKNLSEEEVIIPEKIKELLSKKNKKSNIFRKILWTGRKKMMEFRMPFAKERNQGLFSRKTSFLNWRYKY